MRRFAASSLFVLVASCSLPATADEEKVNLQVVSETIEVEAPDFSDWLFEHRMEEDATPLREEVQKWIATGRGVVLETCVVSVKSGSRTKAESGDETIYPTEFDPPELPNALDLSGKSEAPNTVVGGTAFETRNEGVNFEVDPVLGVDGATVDLNIVTEVVKQTSRIRWPVSKEQLPSSVEMPVFRTQRVTTQVTLMSGRYVLLGSSRAKEGSTPERKEPMILHFVRADVAVPAK